MHDGSISWAKRTDVVWGRSDSACRRCCFDDVGRRLANLTS